MCRLLKYPENFLNSRAMPKIFCVSLGKYPHCGLSATTIYISYTIIVLHDRTIPHTAGARHPQPTRDSGQSYLASDPFPRGCQPHNRFITKDADSKWRALRRRGDPGIDIPDSLPRTTRVGSLPRKKGTVPFVHPEPERGLPYGVGPSEPCIKTGARWAGQAEGTSSLVFIYL